MRQQQTSMTDNSDDANLMDTETQHRYGNLTQQLTPLITLELQRQDDQFTSAIIDYLQTGKLPTDKDLARRVLCQDADYFILYNQLFHLARLKNKKRLHLIAPRFEQLVIPKGFRMQLMQSIHEFSHHGFIKSYLTARQRFY
jgi:hypothetical protein